MINITDFLAEELDVYARMNERQLLNSSLCEHGIFIAESPKVVERALDAGYKPISVLVEDRHVEGEAKEAIRRCGDIPIFTAPNEVLIQLTGFALTRGMLCAMERPAPRSLQEICEGKRRIAILENVMNPTNVGAIFRSAAAMKVEAVVLTYACTNPLYRRAVRVSMGTVFQIPWCMLEEESLWPGSTMDQLKKMGFKTVAMALTDDSLSIDDEKLSQEERLAIILGNEGAGLCDETINNSDYIAKIPMAEGVDSLNVAAASAVAFWQLACKNSESK